MFIDSRTVTLKYNILSCFGFCGYEFLLNDEKYSRNLCWHFIHISRNISLKRTKAKRSNHIRDKN